MKIKKQIEFNNIIKDILKEEQIINLKYENHHGISRLEHSLNVSYLTYLWASKLKLSNINEVTRAALLHDFFFSFNDSSFKGHPKSAVKNAKRVFNINDMQEDIIKNHMFPATISIPKYKETYLVSLADKVIAIRECARYKVPLKIGTLLLFTFNFLTIQR